MRSISILILLSTLITSCSSLMYYPRQEKYYDPVKFNLKMEEVRFANKDGQKIHGWWFESKQKPAKGTWVYFHGNAENITSHFLSLSWLPDGGFNYFIFDYPGYGESEGSPSPYANVSTGEAAIQWVHDNKDSSPLIIYGQSMGGIIAMRTVIEMKDKVPLRIMIADGTFSSFQRIARKKLGMSAWTWLLQPLAYLTLSDRWAPDVEKISPIPLLVIHGEKDTVVEFEHGERIFADAQEPKAFIGVPEGGHNNLFWVKERSYRDPIMAKMEELAPKKP